MNTSLLSKDFDSVYPDFLKDGLNKLGRFDDYRELLALFSALEHFRRDLHEQDTAKGVLIVSHRYIAGLDLFRSAGFWLVNPVDLSFEPAFFSPETEKPAFEKIVEQEIQSRRFAWALRHSSPVFFQTGTPANPERGVLHALSVSSQVVGMFCGILRQELTPSQEINFSLLSLLLGGGSDALATLRKTAQLTSQIKTLSGLLPVCAWCKKVRDDHGYWEQIEHYIASHTDASFTHSICPDCQEQFH